MWKAEHLFWLLEVKSMHKNKEIKNFQSGQMDFLFNWLLFFVLLLHLLASW